MSIIIKELNMKKIVGINGFGRFGLHLLKYWLDRSHDANFQIKYINDDVLTIDQVLEILKNDKRVVFNKQQIKKIGSSLRFIAPCGTVHEIEYTTAAKDEIPWLGKPDIFFECSGKNRAKNDCLSFYTGNTNLVVISATCWDADATLVYGFNHKDYVPEHKVISYGSCTVNAYVPLAEYFNNKWGIVDSDVNVIHNIQEYCLADNYTLNRKFCTLEKSGQNLLNFIGEDNFNVNYTIVPYSGVSIIDFRFRLQDCPSISELISELEHSFHEGSLKGLYNIDEVDIGPEVYNCTTFSSVFIKENIKVINDQVYLPAYFDNENSVNRYYDLLNYITA
jgi:glyceraldehyde 3-phosphate dehydrogenase